MIKKVIAFVLTMILCFAIIGCENESQNSKDESVPLSESSINNSLSVVEDSEANTGWGAKEEKEFWTSTALEKDDFTTKTYLQSFLDNYSECLAASSDSEIPPMVYAMFGYLEANFDEGTNARFISKKGWEAVEYMYIKDLENYKACITRIKEAIDDLSKSESKPSNDSSYNDDSKKMSLENAVQVKDDEYATIWFVGAEAENSSYQNYKYICFVVENKTEYQLIARVDSLAVNGWTLTDAFVYEEIAQHSKAIIKVKTEQIESLGIASLSGVLTLSDKTYELWGTLVRDYPINYIVTEP